MSVITFMLGSVLLIWFSEGQLMLKLMQSGIALPRVVFFLNFSLIPEKKSHDKNFKIKKDGKKMSDPCLVLV